MAIISAFRRLKQKILIQAQFQVHSDAISNKNQEKGGRDQTRGGRWGKKGRWERRKLEGGKSRKIKTNT